MDALACVLQLQRQRTELHVGNAHHAHIVDLHIEPQLTDCLECTVYWECRAPCLEAGLKAAPPLSAMTHVTGPGGLEAVGRSQEIAEKSIAIAAPICIGSLRAPLLGSALLCITVLQFCTNSIKFAILDCHWAFA